MYSLFIMRLGLKKASLLVLILSWIGSLQAEQTLAPNVRVEMAAGAVINGRLVSITKDTVCVDADSGVKELDTSIIRTVACNDDLGKPQEKLIVVGTNGMRLFGARVLVQGDTVSLDQVGGVLTLPVKRVRLIDWMRLGKPTRAESDPEWLQDLPSDLGSDIVMISKGDELQSVACAIRDITADAIRVSLDGDVIPVKKDRVTGVLWLREPMEPGGIIVEVLGGVLSASDLEWTPDALVVDKEIRIPAANLKSIDYASGRMTFLSVLPVERISAEPFFGSLNKVDSLAKAFRPRVLDSGRDLMVRPRTEAVWKVPVGSRVFTSAIAPGSLVGGGRVVISVDGNEFFRATIGDTSSEVNKEVSVGEIPVSGARRLSVVVDYGDSGPVGGVVILKAPVFMK